LEALPGLQASSASDRGTLELALHKAIPQIVQQNYLPGRLKVNFRGPHLSNRQHRPPRGEARVSKHNRFELSPPGAAPARSTGHQHLWSHPGMGAQPTAAQERAAGTVLPTSPSLHLPGPHHLPGQPYRHVWVRLLLAADFPSLPPLRLQHAASLSSMENCPSPSADISYCDVYCMNCTRQLKKIK